MYSLVKLFPSKVVAIMDWNKPYNVTKVEAFWDLQAIIWRFIKDFFTITIALTSLTKKDNNFLWDEACKVSFQKLNIYLIVCPALTLPHRVEGWLRPESNILIRSYSRFHTFLVVAMPLKRVVELLGWC